MHIQHTVRHRLLASCAPFLLWTALGASLPGARADVPAPLTLAVHPYLPAPEIQKRFAPLAEYLATQLGRPVHVRVGSNYEEHIRAIGEDAVDIAYMGPAPYTKLVDRYGRKPILARIETMGKPLLTGVIFVRKDSAIHQLTDLKGKRFAFGDAESTTSSIMPRYVLLRNGIALHDLGYAAHVQSHDNVVLGVLSGDFDAGAARSEIFDEMAGRGLRAIAQSPPVSEHVFVTRANLPDADVRRLRQCLLQLASQPDGQRILQSISSELTGLVPASDSDYDGMRAVVRLLAKEKE